MGLSSEAMGKERVKGELSTIAWKSNRNV